MARRTVDSKMLSLYLDWFYMCMHYMCIALARAPTWQSGRSASVQAGRIGSIVVHGYVRAVRWRCRPGLAVNMDQIGMYFNKVLISIVSLSGILTWTPHNDPFVAMYSQWLASGRPSGLLCVRLVWCGLYDGAAYLSTSESYLHDLGVVRLIPRAAYSPEITVHVHVRTPFEINRLHY